MEMVLFIGIQATGKSECFKQHFYHTHIRLNLDMLKTRNRERLLIEACIKAKQPFVVDNTNPTVQDRKKYIDIANEAGFRIIGYYFQSVVSDSILRNDSRDDIHRVPDTAILSTYKKLELPSYTEGFHELKYVSISENFTFTVEEYKDEV